MIPGEKITISLTIANWGNVTETDVVLTGKTNVETTQKLYLDPGELFECKYEWTVPDNMPGPDELSPVYAFVFKITSSETELNYQNNDLVLRFAYSKEQNSIIPFHECQPGQEVHQWLAYQAYRYFMSQIEGADIANYMVGPSCSRQNNIEDATEAEIIEYLQNSTTYPNNNDLLEGTYAEDQASRDPLQQSWPYLRHFCNGGDGNELYDGLYAYDSAYGQAKNIWNNFTEP